MRARITDYLAYTRPLSIPITMVMVLTGWLACPARPHGFAEVGGNMALLVLVYSVLLWGGSNAFNSAQDRDEGPVNLLPHPPPIPSHLGAFGLSLKLAGVLASAAFGAACVALAAGAALASLFYSWRRMPWRRGKEIPGVDNLINAGGCGLGSFAYGWSAAGGVPDATMGYLGLAWTVCLFGGMPTAQIFQLSPTDTAQSARNWTAWLGAGRTLKVGAALFAVHFFLIAYASPLSASTVVWGASVLVGAAHSAWWSRRPFDHAHARMLRQMTVLTTGQLAWAIGRL